MMDPAYDETEKILKQTEKRITNVYAEAAKEIQEKLDDYLRRFHIKDETWREWVKTGYKTEQQYKEWLKGQIIMGKRWASMRDELSIDLHEANEIAQRVADKTLPDIYRINHDYGVYEIEHGLGVDISYTMYNRSAVERLFTDEDIIPRPGKKVSDAIAEDIAWNRQQVQSAMLQSILQGENLDKMSKRVAAVTAESNRKAAIRNARTLYTGVQNAGRIDSYKRAQSMGIDCVQQWVATLDGRTRHAHRELDGQTPDEDGYFHNELGKIRYPGDPEADPGNIYNCRCTLKASLKGFERDASDLTYRNAKGLEGMSYEKWKEQKESRSNPIDLPMKLSEKMKQKYINEYRYGGYS